MEIYNSIVREIKVREKGREREREGAFGRERRVWDREFLMLMLTRDT